MAGETDGVAGSEPDGDRTLGDAGDGIGGGLPDSAGLDDGCRLNDGSGLMEGCRLNDEPGPDGDRDPSGGCDPGGN